MITENLHGQVLPDDFANRIGRLIEARGNVVNALFDPEATPDILTELSISDEVNRRAVNFHVVQRPAPGIVRGVAKSPAGGLPRGSTVLSSGRHTRTPFDPAEFAEFVRTLDAEGPVGQRLRLLETGLKVIDVMCPLVAGGTLAIAGDLGGGSTVVMEELVRRLSAGSDRLTILLMMPQPTAEMWPQALEPGFSHVEALKKDGYSEGTVGVVQTFFPRRRRGMDAGTTERARPGGYGHPPVARTRARQSLSRGRCADFAVPAIGNQGSRKRTCDDRQPGAEGPCQPLVRAKSQVEGREPCTGTCVEIAKLFHLALLLCGTLDQA